ncbi:hypothetical protein D3C73_894740 [compost metagenome]
MEDSFRPENLLAAWTLQTDLQTASLRSNSARAAGGGARAAPGVASHHHTATARVHVHRDLEPPEARSP